MNTTEEYEFMISSISHEIRNPVTLISSYLQLIGSSHPEVRSYAHWDHLQSEISYLRLLLSDISSFQNSVRLNRTDTNLQLWLAEYAASLSVTVPQLSPQCRFVFEPRSVLPSLCVDAAKLRQLLDNLIRNGIEAATGEAQIILSAWADEASCCISVADNGCGIPADELPRLFEPFVSSKENGTGLGLAISRRIAEAHHGTLTVQSSPGNGTVFTLRLPSAAPVNGHDT